MHRERQGSEQRGDHMGSIRVRQKGNFNNLEKFLKKASRSTDLSSFAKYGDMGLDALKSATPVKTGLTAASWGYHLEATQQGVKLTWYNTNVVNHVQIAIILDQGHQTRDHGWVEGRHYIDPALAPVFDQIMKEMWKELTT